MAKPELGVKRLCAHCGARFYDLLHAPIICPRCGTEFEPPKARSRFKGTPRPEPEAEQPPMHPSWYLSTPTQRPAMSSDPMPRPTPKEDDELNGARPAE
jgi:predicted amidophosphoribosyltransferase